MTDSEQIKKSTVSISLPVAFYRFYMEAKLWQEFSSFSDWVRHAVRRDRDVQKSRIYSETHKNTGDF